MTFWLPSCYKSTVCMPIFSQTLILLNKIIHNPLKRMNLKGSLSLAFTHLLSSAMKLTSRAAAFYLSSGKGFAFVRYLGFFQESSWENWPTTNRLEKNRPDFTRNLLTPCGVFSAR